jgi:hypothetical protein
MANPVSTVALLTEADSVLADNQRGGAITAARLRLLVEDIIASKVNVITGSASAPTVPPAAQAAGFTSLGFNDDFTSNTVASAAAQATGVNWYWNYDAVFPGAVVYPTMLASQVRNGNTTGGANPSANGGILSIQSSGGAATLVSVPGNFLNNPSAVQPPAGQGNWQHCYVEIYTQFNINTASTTGTWPSFWSWSLEGLKSYGFGSSALAASDFVEVDFYESFGPQNFGNFAGGMQSTIHHWKSDGTQPANQVFVHGYPANGGTAAVPPYFDNEWHTIGCLWQHTSNPAPESAATLVQSAAARGGFTGVSPGVITLPQFSSPTTTGHVIIVAVQSFIANAITITDTLGTTYTQAAAQIASGGAMWHYLYYGFATATGTNTVTATQAGGFYFTEVAADEFSGVTAFNTAVHATAASGTITAPSITTAGPGVVYVSGANAANGSTWTAGSGFALIQSSPGGAPFATEYLTDVAAKTGYVATISNTDTTTPYSIIVASFLAPTFTPTNVGSIQMYFDNVAVGTSVETGGTGSTYPLEGQHLFLVLPGAAGSPTYVDWVRVWQAP